MTRCPGCRNWHPPIDRIASAIWAVNNNPEAVTRLDDRTLVVFYRWTGTANPVIAGEVKRRRDRYLELAGQFTNLRQPR